MGKASCTMKASVMLLLVGSTELAGRNVLHLGRFADTRVDDVVAPGAARDDFGAMEHGQLP
jgi:hypothetical protein